MFQEDNSSDSESVPAKFEIQIKDEKKMNETIDTLMKIMQKNSEKINELMAK